MTLRVQLDGDIFGAMIFVVAFLGGLFCWGECGGAGGLGAEITVRLDNPSVS